jgi:hypothetical protein
MGGIVQVSIAVRVQYGSRGALGTTGILCRPRAAHGPKKTPFYFNELREQVNEKICTAGGQSREQLCAPGGKPSMALLLSQNAP